MINIHSPQARYAAHEFHHFLTRVVDEPILLESTGKAGRTCTLVVKPGQAHEIMILNEPGLTTISGRSESSVLHGVYCFLEKMGFVFTARGPVAPASAVPWPQPFTYQHTPTLARRGIRQHLNFPMDISCLPLEAALEYVRNLARLKLNLLAFHLYPNQGWVRLDYKGYRVAMDPRTTLYYSDHHKTSSDPIVGSQTLSRETWFIPEFEAHYRTPEQPKLLRGWLREVMRCAKTCGMKVVASVESISPAADKDLAAVGEKPGLELYARVTAELAFAALEQYPEIDEIEIISQEGERSWPSPGPIKEAAALLRQELNVPAGDWPAAGAALPGEPEELAGPLLISGARQIQVANRAADLMRADERARTLLGPRGIVVGLYTTIYQTMPGLGVAASRLVSPDVPFALMCAYSSRRTARNLAAAALPADLVARSRLYGWCEFDGLMYLLQNECEGIYRCIDQAVGEGAGKTAQLACNHWRTSENEVSIGYLATAAYEGCTPQEFYRSYLGQLMGAKAAPRLAKALAELDDATVYAVEHLFNIGFCALGCWSLRGIWWQADEVAKYKNMLARIAREISAEIPHVARPEGVDRCNLWLTRLDASQVHCDVVTHLRAMHDLVDWNAGKLVQEKPPQHAGVLSHENRAEFTRHAQSARTLARQYVSLCAAAIPDRMSEGVVVSYEHVMQGVIDKATAEFAGGEASGRALPSGTVDGPPAPLG